VDLALLVLATEGPAAVLGWGLAARSPAHRPIAWLLSVGFGSDVARRLLRVAVLAPARVALGTAPYGGAARVAFHAESALFLAWPAAIAATALVVLLRPAEGDATEARQPRDVLGVALVWALVMGALAASYPLVRGSLLARCYLGAELAALVVGVGALATWIGRRRTPEVRHVALALVLAAELVSVLVGPWRVGLFASWTLAQAVYVALFGVLILLQGGAWWMSSPSSS
jgi:hypothetical protein